MEDRLQLLEVMLRIRRFEEKVRDLFADAELPGFVHLYIGQEAVAAGVCAALQPDDYVTSTHRGHGHCIAKGMDLGSMMAELYGKATGACGGKGGSMHIADFECGMLGANGIVGAGAPIAAGAALSSVLLKQGRVTACFFGDGALAQGPWHEGVNLAAVWNLPVLFICENNQYAEMTPTRDQHQLDQLSDAGAAYGMPSVSVDGMDAPAVYEATREAADRAREGGGPALIECLTYRYRGHFEGDPQTYRTREEIKEWQKLDPIEALQGKLLEADELTEEAFGKLDEQIQSEVEDAVEFARNSPDPSPPAAYSDIYCEEGSN